MSINPVYIILISLISIIIIIKLINNYEYFTSVSDCSENPLVNSVPPDRSDIYINTTNLSTEHRHILKTNIIIPDIDDHDNNPLTNKLPLELALITSNLKAENINSNKHNNNDNKDDNKHNNNNDNKDNNIVDTRCTFDKFYKGLC